MTENLDAARRCVGTSKKGHAHDECSHDDAHRQHGERLHERHSGGRKHCADGNAETDHGLHDGALREGHAECMIAPLENEELQDCACAPEKRRDGK